MKRILFVDDDQRILDALQRLLRPQRHEWEMLFVNDGEAALTAFAQAPFDVVVSDMKMPKMDGVALLGHIRERYPQTVRIILSGHPEVESALRAVPVAHQFLSKPCDAATLRLVIERACNLQALLESPTLRQVVGEMGGLPSSPRLYTALTQVLADPDAAAADVARIVEQDMAMCAKVLQLVNSSFFGLVRKITTIQHAVAYLGTDVLRNLVFSTEAFRVFHADLRVRGFSLSELEGHSARAANIATALLKGTPLANEAYLAAMLHDIGKLVLATRLPKRFGEIATVAAEANIPIHQVEAVALGVTHADVGAYLLGLWGVPYPIVEAVAFHHQPEQVGQQRFDLLPAVYVANALAHEGAPGRGQIVPVLNEEYLASLGVLGRLPEWRALADALPAA